MRGSRWRAKYASILLIFARSVEDARFPGPAKYRSTSLGDSCQGTVP
jgi:hypothetical protein